MHRTPPAGHTSGRSPPGCGSSWVRSCTCWGAPGGLPVGTRAAGSPCQHAGELPPPCCMLHMLPLRTLRARWDAWCSARHCVPCRAGPETAAHGSAVQAGVHAAGVARAAGCAAAPHPAPLRSAGGRALRLPHLTCSQPLGCSSHAEQQRQLSTPEHPCTTSSRLGRVSRRTLQRAGGPPTQGRHVFSMPWPRCRRLGTSEPL